MASCKGLTDAPLWPHDLGKGHSHLWDRGPNVAPGCFSRASLPYLGPHKGPGGLTPR